MIAVVKKYWFLLGLLGVFLLTLADTTETLSGLGVRLKGMHGADVAIVLIFFIYGLTTPAGELRRGVRDVKGLGLGLFNIFAVAPLIAVLFLILPLPEGMLIGIFIVAVMPTTLSSGVVMTGAAGGNIAHALLITLTANVMSVVTIPVVLSFLLSLHTGAAGGNIAHALLITLTANVMSVVTIPVVLSFLLSLHTGAVAVVIDKAAIMAKIGFLVVLPLGVGILIRLRAKDVIDQVGKMIQQLNQVFVLAIVWMSLSQTRVVILDNVTMVPQVFLLVFLFHGMLLASAFLLVFFFRLDPGRRESVIFMGAQKTLPLSVIIQVTLFPQYGMALIVCVLHHIVHLFIDSYLVGKIAR